VRLRLATLLSCGVLTGCGGATVGPEATVARVADALERGDRTAVAETRGGASRASALAAEPPSAELRALGAALRVAPVERRSIVTLASTEGPRTVVLVQEGGELRFEAGVLGLSALDTPARAIAALHRALDRELSEGVGGLLSEAERRAWAEERRRYRDGTADPEALDVREDGDRAIAVTPLGDEIVLVREGSEWRVASMRATGLD
jgi:hypothetical protein